ncbi:MAG: hypothetical protein GY928_01995 [Colwellia sp.]|nr:hypothetical protein [Colwellia sp.]
MAKLVITGDKKRLEVIAKRNRTFATKYDLHIELTNEPVKKTEPKKAVVKKEEPKKEQPKKATNKKA